MQRFIISVLAFITAVFSIFADDEKRYRKIIAECDVADIVTWSTTPAEFWTRLQMTNKNYHKASKSLSSNGDKDIKTDILTLLGECDYYFRNVPTREDLYEVSEGLVEWSGLRDVNPFTMLTFTRENDIAAFGYPNGYIFMTDAFYRAVDGDSTTMQAIFAAEAVHSVLQHVYSHSQWEKSRRKKARFWRIFGAVAVAATSIVIDQITDGYTPIIEIGTVVAASLATSDAGQRYMMLYTPLQVYEADIVAYRFMERFGQGGDSYINALRSIGYDLDAANPQGPDFPTVKDRINLLEYMAAHPELREKVKANKRRPQAVAPYHNIFNIN